MGLLFHKSLLGIETLLPSDVGQSPLSLLFSTNPSNILLWPSIPG